jgi:hypothetical protein
LSKRKAIAKLVQTIEWHYKESPTTNWKGKLFATGWRAEDGGCICDWLYGRRLPSGISGSNQNEAKTRAVDETDVEATGCAETAAGTDVR